MLWLTFFGNFWCLSIIAIIFIVCLYFSNYIRTFYYVSKIPGPPAYPIIGNAQLFMGSKGAIINNFNNIANAYPSSIIRLWFGPTPVIMTIDAKIIEELLTNQIFLEKSSLMKLCGKFITGNSILISEVPKWKHNRNIIMKGFSLVILKSYFKIFEEKINILTDKLVVELSSQKSFDIFEYLSKTALDTICGSSMGVNIHAQELNSSYFNAMQSAVALIMKRIFNPMFHSEIIFQMTKDSIKAREYKSIIWGLSNKVINEKRTKADQISNENVLNNNKNAHTKSLLDYLIDLSNNHPNFTDKHLEEEINLIIMAGYETSANALSFILLNLAAHKDVQKKVVDEIREVLTETNHDKIEYDDLPKLKYMEQVIKESMRLHSTVPLIARDVSEDIKIDTYMIPKGVDVIIPIFFLHRNKNYWENPLQFDPERFTSENIKKRHAYAYIPFSGGPRNCIGIRYAWIFMKTVLSTLLSKYEFHTDLDLNKLRLQPEITLKVIGGHQIKITPRQL